MNTQLKNRTEELEQALRELPSDGSLEHLQLVNRTIDECLVYFKEQIRLHAFEQATAEIEFFKLIRPRVIAWKVEEIYKYNLLLNQPISTVANQVLYYEDSIKGIQIFFQLNAFYYQYYKNGFQEMDHIYFRRNSATLSVPVPDVYEIDPECSTPMSDLFARFMAYEAVLHFIARQVAFLNNEVLPVIAAGLSENELKWTGEAVNLVELAYGFWLTGQFNNGNASLNQIVRWLEAHWSVNIGMPQRRFAQIAGRKRVPVTQYLHQMEQAILNKVASGYA